MARFALVGVIVIMMALWAGSLARATQEDAFQLLGQATQRYVKAQGLFIRYSREVKTRSMSMLGGEARGDLATGRIIVMQPHFMRLEQQTPREELIITDGNNLWWYIPEEKKAYIYPGDRFGKQIRLIGQVLSQQGELGEKFKAKVVEEAPKTKWVVELRPDPPWQELDRLLVRISKSRGITGLEMVSPLGTRTIFEFKEVKEASGLKPSLFQFTVPEGVKLIRQE